MEVARAVYKDPGTSDSDKSKIQELYFSELEMNLVQNNQTQYSIIIPESTTATINYAVNELRTLFNEATGAAFAEYAESIPYISIGNTDKFAESGFTADESSIGKTGFVIKSDCDGNIYIVGTTDIGTLNGVYGFLERILSFDYFGKNIYHIDHVSDLSCDYLNIVEKPSFDYRQVNYAELREDVTSYRRMRMQPAPEQYVTGNEYHNSIKILTYKAVQSGATKESVVSEYTNKGWINNGQLCYSNVEMRSAYIESLKLYLNSNYCNTARDVMVLGMEDAVTWCQCQNCSASPSKVYAEFINAVSSAINAERVSNGEKPITFLMFAYYYTLEPPVGVTFNEYSGVMFAPIKARFSLGLENDENAMYERAIQGWKSLTDNIYGWTYNAYFGQTFITYDTFGVLQGNYRLLLKYGVKGLYDQTESYMAVSTGFGRLKGYIQSKLLWNVNADVNALIDKYFVNVYGNAAETMKTVFIETREYYKKLYNYENIYNGQTGKKDSDTTKYSEYSVDFTTAYRSLQPGGIYRNEFKSKLETWLTAMNSINTSNVVAERIRLETLQYRYLYISLYGESETITKTNFKSDIEYFGIGYYKEGKTVSELWTKWGIV